MSLSLQHRRSLHASLAPITGEEEADALLAQFPSRPEDEPVTRDVLRAELAEVRTELADLRGHVDVGLADLRGHVDVGLAELRADLKAETTVLRAETADLRSLIELHSAHHDARLSEAMRLQTKWVVSVIAICLPVCTGLAALVGR